MENIKIGLYKNCFTNNIDYELEEEYFAVIGEFAFWTNGSFAKYNNKIEGYQYDSIVLTIEQLREMEKKSNDYPFTHNMIEQILIIIDQSPKRLENLSNYHKKTLIYYGFYLENLIYDDNNTVRLRAITKFGKFNTIKYKILKWLKN